MGVDLLNIENNEAQGCPKQAPAPPRHSLIAQ
jgi:hypothetical protein